MKLTLKAVAFSLLVVAPVAARAQAPTLTITEATRGSWEFTGIGTPVVLNEVADENGAVFDFSWSAVPGGGASITDYRYGWDLLDPNDDGDPGWSAWGGVLSAPARTFFAGTHVLTVEARNDLSEIARGTIQISVSQGPVSTQAVTWSVMKVLYR